MKKVATGLPNASGVFLKNDNDRKFFLVGFQNKHFQRFIGVSHTYESRPKKQLTLIPHELFEGNGEEAFEWLANEGIVVAGSERRNEIIYGLEGIKQFPTISICSSVGWNHGGFVFPDGEAIPRHGKKKVAVSVGRVSAKCGAAGSLDNWLAHVAIPLSQHEITAFMMMAGFTPLIQRFSSLSENVIFELVGKPKIGKTTALNAVASVFGAVGDVTSIEEDEFRGRYWIRFDEAIARPWRTAYTHVDLPVIATHVDEAFAIETGAVSNAYIRRVLNILRAGPDDMRPVPDDDCVLTLLLSARSSLTELSGDEEATDKALRGVLFSLRVPDDRPCGVLDALPEGYQSAADFFEEINRAAANNFGNAKIAYVTNMIERLDGDEAALRTEIEAYVSEFRAASGVDVNDGLARHEASVFGLAYAAGRLGQDFGALPPELDALKCAISCYRLYKADVAAPLTLRERLDVIADDPSTVDLGRGDLAEVSDDVHAKANVFVRQSPKGREVQIRPRAVTMLLRGFPLNNDEALSLMGVKPKGRLTRNRQLGRGRPQEPMYCFLLDSITE